MLNQMGKLFCFYPNRYPCKINLWFTKKNKKKKITRIHCTTNNENTYWKIQQLFKITQE